MRGKLIVLEGGEGSGKSTIASYLREALPKDKFIFTRDPGGTPFAEEVRKIILSDVSKKADTASHLGLFFSGRLDNVKNVIRPALERGTHVILERFVPSTYAYQICGQERKDIQNLFEEWVKVLDIEPDLYIMLDVDPKAGLRRMRANSNKPEPIDHFEERELAFHERVREGLLRYIGNKPHKILDANRPIENVKAEVLSIISEQTK